MTATTAWIAVGFLYMFKAWQTRGGRQDSLLTWDTHDRKNKYLN
jgi:hypothetical protein